jgi:DNA-binding LytR/AlgR family response regulator
VVFITAYDRYAVAAFEQGAVDYVLKPFSMARLAETVTRLQERLRDRPANLDGILGLLSQGAPDRKKYLRWVTASQGNTTSFITVEQVCYFRADNKYTLVITPDREAVIRRPIKDLAEAVDPDMFWQIHRSTLVNINAIAGVARDFRGHLHVKLKERKETLAVSEPYVHLFRQM